VGRPGQLCGLAPRRVSPCARSPHALHCVLPRLAAVAPCESLLCVGAFRAPSLPFARPLVFARPPLPLPLAAPSGAQLPPPPCAASRACWPRLVWPLAGRVPRPRTFPSASAVSHAPSAECPSPARRPWVSAPGLTLRRQHLRAVSLFVGVAGICRVSMLRRAHSADS
jgi:hypothetical protein